MPKELESDLLHTFLGLKMLQRMYRLIWAFAFPKFCNLFKAISPTVFTQRAKNFLQLPSFKNSVWNQFLSTTMSSLRKVVC